MTSSLTSPSGNRQRRFFKVNSGGSHEKDIQILAFSEVTNTGKIEFVVNGFQRGNCHSFLDRSENLES